MATPAVGYQLENPMGLIGISDKTAIRQELVRGDLAAASHVTPLGLALRVHRGLNDRTDPLKLAGKW